MCLALKIAVCDDERYYREHIQRIICRYLDQKPDIVYEIELFEDGTDFCSDKNIESFDVIFLDIEMKKMNGMDAAYEIRKKNKDMDIVFITVLADFVFEGYKVKAERYIMKQDFEKELPECLEIILKKRWFDDIRMEFSFVGGNRTIRLKDLMYVESKSHRLRFVREEDVLYLYGQVDDLEKELSPYHFVRCHQSFLVNLEYVEKTSNYQFYLSDGTQIPISRPRYAQVRKKLLLFKEL